VNASNQNVVCSSRGSPGEEVVATSMFGEQIVTCIVFVLCCWLCLTCCFKSSGGKARPGTRRKSTASRSRRRESLSSLASLAAHPTLSPSTLKRKIRRPSFCGARYATFFCFGLFLFCCFTRRAECRFRPSPWACLFALGDHPSQIKPFSFKYEK
jgi:hypothetical protein